MTRLKAVHVPLAMGHLATLVNVIQASSDWLVGGTGQSVRSQDSADGEALPEDNTFRGLESNKTKAEIRILGLQ